MTVGRATRDLAMARPVPLRPYPRFDAWVAGSRNGIEVAILGGASLLMLALEAVSPRVAIAVAALALLSGIAHGAVRTLPSGHVVAPGWRFCSIYLLAGLCVAGGFLVAPAVLVALFFAFSAGHFAKAEGRIWPLGIFATFAAFLFHPQASAELIDLIAENRHFAGLFADAGAMAAVGFLVLTLFRIASIEEAMKSLLTLLAFALLSPLAAISAYFLAHSAAAYLAPIRAGQTPVDAARSFVRIGAPATAFGAIGIAAYATNWIEIDLIAAAAFGFVIPHILADLTEASAARR